MYLDGAIEAKVLACAALAALDRHEIPATPDNFALWYEYHSGRSPNLQRTIDVIISNNAGFDTRTLHDLYATFFTSLKEQQAVREASSKVQHTLHEVIGIADRARGDAGDFGATLDDVASRDLGRSVEQLNETVQHLLAETQKMAGKSAYAGVRLRESVDKIESLERNLETALQDAKIDCLTGIPNRKAFELAIRKLAGDAMNSGDDLALLMVDVDRFKRVNDTWGHPVGDLVLRHVSQTLQRSVRGQDLVARYGGEEFAIILPNTNGESALSVGENLRTAMAREPLTLEVVPPLESITISVGVSCYEPGDPLAEWIERTDAALYRAKREGRNRVELN